MWAARIYRPAELIGGKSNYLRVQACHGPAKGRLLGRGQRRHTLATQPRLGGACGRGEQRRATSKPSLLPRARRQGSGETARREPLLEGGVSHPKRAGRDPVPNRRRTESKQADRGAYAIRALPDWCFGIAAGRLGD